MEKRKTERLESLDVLRGFDLFCLVGLEAVVHSMGKAVNQPWFDRFLWNFSHVSWEGFSPWDLVMPLFLFMAGVSLPFALSRYQSMPDKTAVYRRILKRVALLWIFGMMCQGNLLGLDSTRIYFYTNTLQAIAMGYLIASMLFLHTKAGTQIGVAGGLLATYWAAMQLVHAGGCGGGDYTPEGNLAEWIDRTVLGRFRDAAQVVDGQVVFAGWYRYTWILSSINFGVTVLTGVFAGHILRSSKTSPKQKWQWLVLVGLALVAAGWLWHLQMPVIKKLWTSSMVLVSSGYCFVLMGLFYYWIDYRGNRKYLTWLKVYGMNSIVAYLLASCVNFRSIGESVFFGLEQYIGPWYPVLIGASNAGVIFLILWVLYRKGLFLKA